MVLGTHGRGAVAHLLVGSVAERVVRTASCPVLTVRHPDSSLPNHVPRAGGMNGWQAPMSSTSPGTPPTRRRPVSAACNSSSPAYGPSDRLPAR